MATPSIIQEILNQGFPQRQFMNSGIFPQRPNPVRNAAPMQRPVQIGQQPSVPLMMQAAQNGYAAPQPAQQAQPAQQPPVGLLGGLDDPRAQGLLSAAASLLQSSGWSPTPVTFGQALGGAAGAGLGAYNQASQANLNKRYVEAQIGKLSQPEMTELMKNAAAAGIQPGTPEFAELFRQKVEGKERGQYSTLAYGPNGELLAFNTRTEGLRKLSVPGESGQSVVSAKFNPNLQGRLSASKQLGESVGKEVADVGRGLDALTSITDARDSIDKGIYTGYWANVKKTAAKATPGVDTTKAANTEEFMSHIGNVVIPRLKDFGGNDTVEEMKYLQKVMAGEITMEEQAIRNILNRAEKKLQAKMKRLGQQAEGAGLGGQLQESSISTEQPRNIVVDY